jgi:hypothetical protein
MALKVDAGVATELTQLSEHPNRYWMERAALPWN